jgi:hypothetical protein
VEVKAMIDMSAVELKLYLLAQDGHEVPLAQKEFLSVSTIESVAEETGRYGNVSFTRGIFKDAHSNFFKYSFVKCLSGPHVNETLNIPWTWADLKNTDRE